MYKYTLPVQSLVRGGRQDHTETMYARRHGYLTLS